MIGRAVLLDLETGHDGRIHKIGALRGDRELRIEGRFELERALAQLGDFAAGTELIIGHNLLGHDLPTLRTQAPALTLLGSKIVDTLYLSPLAFPQNPYHRLVKDYKLVRDSLADPIADCRLAERLLREQYEELTRRARRSAEERAQLAVFQFCFRGATLLEAHASGGDGIADVLQLVSGRLPALGQVRSTLLERWQGRACTVAAPRLILDHLADPNLRPVLAYAAAWLDVAGGDSVLPPWVRHRFPATARLLTALRETPCDDPDCRWCRTIHDPDLQLRRWFGFSSFRTEPASAEGDSLQRAIVRDGIAGRALLAILPTGGGKSLCFQLPALVRSARRGTLTVVISPLQALMKDQVDNLAKRTGTTAAAAIYGMLTPPERGDVMDRVRLGDVALLYISPEQLRNRSVAETLASREIGCWVFDEAHCLSKWGHDFRPDYLYAGRFIRTLAQRQQTQMPPVTCFTATAKRDVTAEILAYFRTELGLDLTLYESGVERDNLSFEVQLVGRHEKEARIQAILAEHLTARNVASEARDAGAAIVYASKRKRVEDLSERLEREGWAAAAFHAGIDAPEKRRIQDAFLSGEIQVICATNAFGMGVDKDNVRVVIHAEIPGSLENYLQEAGRAGRDRKPAVCVLLYDEQDIESQFGMAAMSELSRRDIAEILRGLRRAKPDRDGVVVVTSGELLRDEDLRLGFAAEARDSDTRVRIAVAWLERAGLVQRDENRTFVFQGRPAVASLADAARQIAGLRLSDAQQQRWLAILHEMLNAEPDAGFTADDLARLPGFVEPANERCRGEGIAEARQAPLWDRGETPAQRVLRTLHDMANAGLLRRGPQLSAFLRHRVRDHSMQVLERVARLEQAMLEVLCEQAPEAEPGEWLPLSLRRLNQHLLDQGQTSNPETLRTLLKGLSLDGRGLAGARGSLDLFQVDRDHYRVRLHRDLPTLVLTAERRRGIAAVVLSALVAKIPKDAPGSAAQLVAFGTDELTDALRLDTALAGEIRDPLAAVDRGLMFLHEHAAIVLHGGFAVFRSAMTVRILPEAKGRRYTKAQYQPLAQHYSERVFQIHVMNEYARLGAEKIRQALALVSGYFSLGKEAFVRRWFADRREQIVRATTAESFRRIVESLGNPAQAEIVAAAEDGNRLVLAGPGSGKTRVIVHRCGYLVRVLRVPAHRLLVLCFNRSAALELRRRLAALIGEEARGITVQTYHGFAMRLTGRSYAERLAAADADRTDSAQLDRVIAEAVTLLEGRDELAGVTTDGDRQAIRERLLAGFRHILVDEYQDIDADQYRLVAAIAGRSWEVNGDEAGLTLLAVGDDDQNIYAFRGASTEYIRRFRDDYDAELHHLIENYRSSGHVIAAANALIAQNRERMKVGRPIRIDHRRANEPAGGRWSQLDRYTHGRALVLSVSDTARQAAALVARIAELRRLGGGGWSQFALLARAHDVLAAIRAWLEHESIPVALTGDLPSLHRVREIDQFLDLLRERNREVMCADELMPLLPPGASPWRELLESLIVDWRAEAGTAAVPAVEISEFCYETLAEQRRDGRFGDGVLLTTLHGAKGLEFPHVLIADGGWGQGARDQSAVEEERRLFYVGMTRAQETLTLGRIADARHPHLPLIAGDWLIDAAPVIEPPPTEIVNRRYTRLTPADIDLGYAGRQLPSAPIHGHLRALAHGDDLRWRQARDSLLLLDRADHPVGRLSRRAASEWIPRLEQIESICVEAILRQNRRHCGPDYAQHCRCERWEVPLIEICWRKV